MCGVDVKGLGERVRRIQGKTVAETLSQMEALGLPSRQEEALRKNLRAILNRNGDAIWTEVQKAILGS